MTTTELPDGTCVYPCGHVGICDHCGTIQKAVAVWTDFEIDGCECLCHVLRQHLATAKKKGKKK